MRPALLAALLLVPALVHADPPRVVPTWPADWPLDTAPIISESWPSLPEIAAGEPATPSSARAFSILLHVQAVQRDARYQHRTDVREASSRYRWDCSGMVSWVVAHSARRASAELGAPRVIARRIYETMSHAPETAGPRGWQHIADIRNVEPGDVFAWRTPAGYPSPHSGHTGFVMSRAILVPGIRNGYAVRIADSIVGPHEADTRPDGTLGSLGFGVMVFLTDDEGHPTHAGWHGTRTAGYLRAPIAFGRLLR